MTTDPTDLVSSTCSEDPQADATTCQPDKPRSQPVELKIFPAPKRHCNTEGRPNHNHNATNSPNRDAPHVEVKKSTSMRYDPEEDYKMSANPRGICLIINNVNFELDSLPERKGSNVDALRFKKILKQLGFQVRAKKNMPAGEMKNEFISTAALCAPRHDALIVILMSHGSESGIYGSDGCEVNLYDMLTYFDNKNCKQMLGKPKVFIVQACRGRKADYGVREQLTFLSQPNSQGFTQPSQLSQIPDQNKLKLSRWSELDTDYHPTCIDMMLCFSCHLGFGSIRNEDEGSWLGTSLANHLQESACKKHLMEILNMVSRDVRLRKSTDGHKQVLEITMIGFDRNLYFNPGLYKTNTNTIMRT